MAKKKKGLASSLREQYTSIPVVKDKAAKTVSTNVSGSSSGGNTGGFASSFRQKSKETATQKAERQRSEQMRKGLSTIVRSSYKQQISKPTYVQKSAFSNLRNVLAPIKTQPKVTGGQGIGSSKSVLGYKKTQALAPVKQDIKNNYYDATRKVGMKGSRNERTLYVPLSQRDENGQISENQRRLYNQAQGGNRKAQVEAEMARTKAQTGSGHSYDEIVNAGLRKTGLMGQDYILRNLAPTDEEMDYRKRYGYDEEARQAVLDAADKRFTMGLDESYRARKLEDTLKRQYGVDLTDEEQAKLDAARDSWAYTGGNVLGQASQFAMTAPLSGLVEGGLMAKAGLKGGKAAIKTAKDALKYAGARITADQIVSAPINILDALKEDNAADVIKRFGLNTGMDLLFGGLVELPGFAKNMHFVRGLELNNAANAVENAEQKLVGKIGARRELKQAVDEAGDTARVEAENVMQAKVGAQRPIASATEDADEVARRYTNMQEYGQLDEPVEDLTFQMRRGMNDYDNATGADLGNADAGERFAAMQNYDRPLVQEGQVKANTPKETPKKAEAPKVKPKAEAPADKSREAWDDIPNVAKSEKEPEDLMRKKPNRKENTIPKASEQKVKKEVYNRGEGIGNASAEKTATETPKRRQVKGVLNEEKPKTKTAEQKKVEWDREDIREAERKSRNLTNKEKKAAEKHGTHPYGEPKVIDGEETSKAGDTILSRKDSVLHDDVRLRGMEGVTNEGAGRKTTKKFNESLESAAERYKSDPHAFKERLRNARESVRKGEFPEGYTNRQDFFSDEVELQKQFTKRLNSVEKGSDEYWELVDDAWEYAQDALAGGSQAGGDLQQYKAFVNAHPGVKAASIDKTLERLYKRFEKRLKKAGINELTLPKEMRADILTAETKEEASKAWAKASVYVWNQIPASFKEKADFIRINAMLLNPKTHIRNLLGNAVFLPMREMKNITGTGLEYIAMKAGVLDKAARTKTIIPDAKAMKVAKDVRKKNPAIRGASRLFENLANGRPLEDGMTFMAGRQNGDPVINGIRKFLDKTGKANAWLLEHEDFVFFNGAFDRQFGRITKARGLTAEDLLNNPKLLDDVTEAATEEALRATYRDESAVARMISKWKNPPKNASAARKAAGLALDAILPFTKTPINILRRAIDYSPAGAGKGIYHLARGIHDGNQKMIVKGLDQLASSIPGSGIGMLGWFLAENDGVTSKLGSDKDDQFMRDLGKQNFSIVFNAGTDKEWSYTLDWAAPGCIPFFTGVAMKEMSDEGVDFWEAADAFEQMFEPMTEMSVMQGIKNTLETFQRESGGGVVQGLISAGVNTGLQYAGQFKPTISGQIARTIDDTRRDTTSTAETATKRQVERWVNKQKAGIPGLSKTLPAYQNVWGDEEKNTYNENLPMRIVENFFSPGYAKKYKADEVDKEILNLYKQDPSNSKVIPSKLSGYEIGFDGGTVRLTEEERANYIKVQGKTAKEELKKQIKTGEYKNKSLAEKQKVFSNEYSDAGAAAKRSTLLKMGKDEWKVYTDDFSGSKKDYKAAKAAGIPAKTYFNIVTSKDADISGNGRLYKSEAVMYLNSLDLTDEQREIMFPKLSTAKNPYTDGTAHSTDWKAQYEKDLAKSEKTENTKLSNAFAGATPREEGSLAAKLFNKSVIEKAKESSDSSSSSSKSRRSRSGRRGGSGRSGGSSKSTFVKSKIKANKSSVDLEKIYNNNKANIKTPTFSNLDINSAKKLSKSQKKALIKLLQKKLNV